VSKRYCTLATDTWSVRVARRLVDRVPGSNQLAPSSGIVTVVSPWSNIFKQGSKNRRWAVGVYAVHLCLDYTIRRTFASDFGDGGCVRWRRTVHELCRRMLEPDRHRDHGLDTLRQTIQDADAINCSERPCYALQLSRTPLLCFSTVYNCTQTGTRSVGRNRHFDSRGRSGGVHGYRGTRGCV
jgi:hypothetical protein